MAINFKNVDQSTCKKASYPGTSEFVQAIIDPATKHQLNLPENYKYYDVLMPKKYTKWVDRFRNFKVREDDVWIVGFPKTGTTWIHNIAWQLKNNLNFAAPARRSFDEHFDAPIIFEDSNGNEKFQKWIDHRDKSFDRYDDMPSPRIFKTHLPAFLLPKDIFKVKAKIIQIARDPRDCIVSLYHNARNSVVNYDGTTEIISNMFINNLISFSPFFEHIFSYWQIRHFDNVLFLTYEQLSADLFAGVQRTSEFLGCSYSETQLIQLTEHVSFKTMSKHFPENVPVEVSARQDPGYK